MYNMDTKEPIIDTIWLKAAPHLFEFNWNKNVFGLWAQRKTEKVKCRKQWLELKHKW